MPGEKRKGGPIKMRRNQEMVNQERSTRNPTWQKRKVKQTKCGTTPFFTKAGAPIRREDRNTALNQSSARSERRGPIRCQERRERWANKIETQREGQSREINKEPHLANKQVQKKNEGKKITQAGAPIRREERNRG